MLLMEHNQNTITAINHQRLIRIKFQDYTRLFHQSLMKKLAIVEKLYFSSRWHALVGVAVLWRFKRKKNAYGVFAATKKKERKKEKVAVSGGSTVFLR